MYTVNAPDYSSKLVDVERREICGIWRGQQSHVKVQQSNNTEEAGGMKEFGDTPSEKQGLRSC